MGSSEGFLDTPVPALDVVIELAAAPVGEPELRYSDPQALIEPASIDAVLSATHSSLTVQWSDGSTLNLDHSELDRTIEQLAGAQPGLQASPDAAGTPWDAQSVLRGTSGNDRFVVADRPDPGTDQLAVTFDATQGSDRYQGSHDLDRISYAQFTSDSLSGLYIADSPDQLPLVANNLPPLIAADFANDALLVYKNYESTLAGEEPQVDLLKNVEVLSLGDGDDLLVLNSDHPSLVVDFAGGLDRVRVATTGDQPDVTHYLGLELLDWTPLGPDGEPLLSQPIPFSVLEWQEDATSVWPVGAYPPDPNSDATGPWQLSSFALPEAEAAPLPAWVELLELPPTPELVGDGHVVVSRNWIQDASDPTLLWLEISVHDLRPGGLGLVGLEINLDWNASALELQSDSFNTDEVFNRDHLPLFQSLGNRASASGRESIRGLGAAALPRAGQGVALGLNAEGNGQSLFARLGFRRENPQQAIDLRLTPTLTPAAGGVSLAADDLLVLDDSSPNVWVIRATPEQDQVGSHAFTLRRGELHQHVAVAVRAVNDAPQAVALSADKLHRSLDQDSQLAWSTADLFSDQDDSSLTYTLLHAPAWVQLDPASGMLSGLPGNGQVGEHTITVQAFDRRGSSASQTLRLEVLNVNDSPLLGAVALELPQLSQGQSFTYRIPAGVFSDPDLLVDPREQLTYSLEAIGEGQVPPAWITIDASSGTISGQAGPADVGDNKFVVRATDRAGLFVEQAVVLTVANVNDAPSRTSALDAFLAQQQPTAQGSEPPSENNPLALFSGLERTINLRDWFSDLDLNVDPDESLSLAVTLDPGSGNLIDLSDLDATPEWLHWDQTSGLLTLRPGLNQIGEHYLRVRATDAGGLSAAALVPLLVRHRNSAPIQQLNSAEEIVKASRLEGVLATTPLQHGQLLTGLRFELAEDASIRIELPTKLFGDIDLSIDPAERLTYSLTSGEVLPFQFDPASLSLSGNTSGLALEATDGRTSWSAQLLVADAAGATAAFDLDFVLQRSAVRPDLTVLLPPELARWGEASTVALADLLTLNLPARPGEVLKLWLERTDSDPQSLVLLNDLDQPLLPQADGRWLLVGTADEVRAQLTQLSLVVPGDAHAIGTFGLRATARTELGNTGLQSEDVVSEINFGLDPVSTAPRWLQHNAQGASDPFALNTFAAFLTAELVDPREQLLYAIELPTTGLELLITDRAGDLLGTREGSEVLLTPEQWAEAMLRSVTGDAQPIDLQVRAYSSEPSTDLQAASDPQTLSWLPTPLLRDGAEALLLTPNGVQRSGEATNLSLSLSWPEAARSAQLQIDLPLGSAVELEGFEVQQSEVNGKQRFVITLRAGAAQPLPKELNLQVYSPEIFRGSFAGSLQLLSSVRSDLPAEGLTAGALAADRDASLARLLEAPMSFSWNVAQVAKTPEFSPDADLRFDPLTGALQIGLRRGSSSSGLRNPAESLTVSVRNIPPGYTLAEQVNGVFRPAGATDAFGTMTLFTLQAEQSDATPADLEDFVWLNNNNLYLVRNNKPNPKDLDGVSLRLSITAHISDQPGGDSRSAAATRQLNLTPFSINAPPRLSAVDPLILDLTGQGLKLTSLEASLDQGISFAMLPQAGAIPTAWLSPEANAEDQRTAALLVLNDTTNDGPDGDVRISSITELLSEYFQSEGLTRSFGSGSAALASLNSNGDLLLNASDQAWSDLMLWFDDGDAVSQAGELVAISDVLTSIDLGSVETIAVQPGWAAGNAVLRRLSALDMANPSVSLDLYDIGLEVAPAGSAPLVLTVNGPLQMQENGDPVAIPISIDNSESWAESLDALTLIRLSGLPDALIPSLGVKDSRGDWLFTWADLKANGEQLAIIPGPDWSGSANLQLLISQLQPDGTLLSSAFTSLALDVEAVADVPLLQINSTTIAEDTPVALSKLLGRATLSDTDGSETLNFELHGLPHGARIQRLNDGLISVLHPAEGGVYRFAPAELDELFFVPPADLAGQLSFQWHAVAQESSNGSTEATIANVLINVRAVADAPLMPELTAVPPSLVEGQSVALRDLIQQPMATTGLRDTDGSEQLRLELNLPAGLRLQNPANRAWTPLSAQTMADGRRVVVINAADIEVLRLADLGIRSTGAAEAPTSLQLTATRISRETSTGDQARSSTLTFDLAFDRSAQKAILTIPAAPAAVEDDGGIALSALLQAKPAQTGDVLSYRLSGLAAGLSLVDALGTVQPVPVDATLDLASLDGWRLQTSEHRSGLFSVELQVISRPPGQGGMAQSSVQRLPFTITPVADTPALMLGATPEAPLTIGSNGWLDLGAMQFNLSTPDQDSSERLSVVITAVNAAGDPVALPKQAQFNVPAQQLANGSWIVQQSDLASVKLFLGEIAEVLQLAISPRSRDGDSIAIGEATVVDVAANAVVRMPLLEVRGVLAGFEDQPIPLLSQLDGVITAQLRGQGAGQTLELEISGLPAGSWLVRLENADGEEIAHPISSALNRNHADELTTSLRLPYSDWQNVFWQPPADQSGSFSFTVQAFSVGSGGQTLASEISTVQALVTAVNDAPRLANLQDLDAVDEGVAGSWDLRARFVDIDHAAADLVITAHQVNGSGGLAALPTWLSLGADGVLSGTPSNSDVGVLQLQITAVDPLGELTSQRVSLTVGDVNAAPEFNAQALQGWSAQSQSGTTNYLRSIDLRQQVQINLNATFNDADLINGDQLSYAISRDGVSWSQGISGLAQINNGTLTIQPQGKEYVGVQTIQMRVTDLRGASNIQSLRLTVRNINDPPVVTRQGALLVRAGVWQETVTVNQGADFQLNLEGLFRDADAGDRIDQILPNSLPSWLSYTPAASGTGGVLRGTPGNGDVGLQTLQWQALDNAGATATYRLRLEVRNVNDAPQVRPNPDLTELGTLINGTPTVEQDDYGRLDLSELFSDPDSPYGDALRYSIASVLKDGTPLATAPEWLGLTYRSTVAPDAAGKLLLEPVLYRITADGSTGSRLSPGEISQLAADTPLRVVIEATDDRAVPRKGLIGVDLDVSLSPSLSLLANSTQISNDLPLFRQISFGDSTLRVVAGSAPDAGAGAPVGDQAKETLLTFDVVLNNPNQRVVIGLSQGEGDTRDGLSGRDAEAFDQSNSVIHSFASKIYLEALNPSNEAVGSYQVVLKANDLAGEQVSKTLSLAINNRNDAPRIDMSPDQQGITELQKLVNWLSFARTEGDRSAKSFRLFTDPDLRFGDSLNYTLTLGAPGENTNGLLDEDSIRMSQLSNGSMTVELNAPRGLTESVEQQFKLTATDAQGLTTSTDWFTAVFKPIAEATALTRSRQGQTRPLKAVEIGASGTKNTTLDLQSVLDLNAITLSDPQGDKVTLKLLVNQSEAQLALNSSDIRTFFERETTSDGVLFSIDLKALNNITGTAEGSLEGLHLTLNPNQLEQLPRSISPALKTGVPIQLWTETRVQGDTANEPQFNLALTDRSTVWIPLQNTRPNFTQQGITRLDADFFEPATFYAGQTLIRLSDVFNDVDALEQLSWELETPKELEGLLILDNDAGEIKLAASVTEIGDLPTGNHRLLVRAKDSSGRLGDPTGVASGSIRLVVSAPTESSSTLSGLILLTSLDTGALNALLAKEQIDLNESEQQALTLLNKFNIRDTETADFLQKLEAGSLAVLTGVNTNQQTLLIDTSLNPGTLLTEANITAAETQELEASNQLLIGREIADTPLGKIQFTVDTQGRDFGVVELQMEQGGVDFDILFKSDASGIPLIFRGERVTYKADYGDIDDWLESLSYGIYVYDPADPRSINGAPIITIKSNEESLSASLLSTIPLFDLTQLGSIDGSGYLIDLDANGTVDLVRMLLVDQGWFDTRQDVIGLIGDPLIPAKTKIQAEEARSSRDIANQSQFQNTSTSSGAPQTTISGKPKPANSGSFNLSPGSAGERPDTVKSDSFLQQRSASDGGGSTSLTSNQNIGQQSFAENLESSDLGDKSTKSTQERPSLSDAVQRWLNERNQDINEFTRLLSSPLQKASETKIAVALGMLLLPLLSERAATAAAKAMDRDLRLKLQRRDPDFNGRWLVLLRHGGPLVIHREQGRIRLENQFKYSAKDGLTALPGFNQDGASLLSQLFAISRAPGALAASISTTLLELQRDDSEINWSTWLDLHFNPTIGRESIDSTLSAIHAWKELKALVARAIDTDPALADVVMFSQLLDCAGQLGLTQLPNKASLSLIDMQYPSADAGFRITRNSSAKSA